MFNFYSERERFLSWYHNGTQLSTSKRVNITENGTVLILNNIVESDAGTYEVKFHLNKFESTRECDRSFLRALENSALHAPVTFYVQQNIIPTYDSEEVINIYLLPSVVKSPKKYFIINNIIDINVRFGQLPLQSHLLKNGLELSVPSAMYNYTVSYGSIINLTHIFTYNNPNDAVGYYMHIQHAEARPIGGICRNFYQRLYELEHKVFVLEYWSIKIYSELVVIAL